MKRIVAAAVVVIAGLAAMAQTCVVTNESLTTIGSHDRFAGEMWNDSGVNILQHEFIVAFLDKDGEVIETRKVDGCLRSLQDGGSDFFSASSSSAPAATDIALARIANLREDHDFTLGKVKDGNIGLTDVTANRDGAVLTVAGTVTNLDNETLEQPAVCAVVWKLDGRIVTTGKLKGLADLVEGASAQFSLQIAVPDDGDAVNEVDVYVDGLEDDVPVDPGSKADVLVTSGTSTPTVTATATATVTETPTATPTP
jgi:hypothetical protein